MKVAIVKSEALAARARFLWRAAARPAGWAAVVLSLALAVSGCATMRYPNQFKVDGKECRDFKELDDEKALKLIAMIYNVRGEDATGEIARRIVLEQYINLVAKRKSRYCKGSGIFDIKYDKVDLAKYEDEELIRLYEDLEPRAGGYRMESAQELSESENAKRIVYLTAICRVAGEIKKRDNTRQAMNVAGQVLAGALTVAMSLI